MDQQSEQLSFDLAGLTRALRCLGNWVAGATEALTSWTHRIEQFTTGIVAGAPPHLVRTYLQDFGLDERHTVLDPFCGTGTTVVECKLNYVKGVGLEANPFAHFASTVKLDWEVDAELLNERARAIAAETMRCLDAQGIKDNEPIGKSLRRAVKVFGS